MKQQQQQMDQLQALLQDRAACLQQQAAEHDCAAKVSTRCSEQMLARLRSAARLRCALTTGQSQARSALAPRHACPTGVGQRPCSCAGRHRRCQPGWRRPLLAVGRAGPARRGTAAGGAAPGDLCQGTALGLLGLYVSASSHLGLTCWRPCTQLRRRAAPLPTCMRLQPMLASNGSSSRASCRSSCSSCRRFHPVRCSSRLSSWSSCRRCRLLWRQPGQQLQLMHWQLASSWSAAGSSWLAAKHRYSSCSSSWEQPPHGWQLVRWQ